MFGLGPRLFCCISVLLHVQDIAGSAVDDAAAAMASRDPSSLKKVPSLVAGALQEMTKEVRDLVGNSSGVEGQKDKLKAEAASAIDKGTEELSSPNSPSATLLRYIAVPGTIVPVSVEKALGIFAGKLTETEKGIEDWVEGEQGREMADAQGSAANHNSSSQTMTSLQHTIASVRNATRARAEVADAQVRELEAEQLRLQSALERRERAHDEAVAAQQAEERREETDEADKFAPPVSRPPAVTQLGLFKKLDKWVDVVKPIGSSGTRTPPVEPHAALKSPQMPAPPQSLSALAAEKAFSEAADPAVTRAREKKEATEAALSKLRSMRVDMQHSLLGYLHPTSRPQPQSSKPLAPLMKASHTHLLAAADILSKMDRDLPSVVSTPRKLRTAAPRLDKAQQPPSASAAAKALANVFEIAKEANALQ